MSNTKSVVVAKPAPAQPKAPALKAKAHAAPTPDAKTAEAKPKAAKAEAKPKAPSINIGVKSGMHVMAYQDHTFEINATRKLTNEELAADWRAEFPNSKAVKAGRITAEMVAAVRSLYNRGTGGHGTPGVKHESVAFEIVNGKRLPVAVPERKAAEPKADAKAAPAPKATTKTAAAKPPVPTQPAKAKHAAA